MDMDAMNIELWPALNLYTKSCTRIQCQYNVYTMSCIHEYGAPYSWIWMLWISSSALNTMSTQCLCHVLYKNTMSIQCLVFMNMELHIQKMKFLNFELWPEYNTMSVPCLVQEDNVYTMSRIHEYGAPYSWIDSMNIELWPEYNTMSIQCLVREYNVYTMSCIHEYGAPYSWILILWRAPSGGGKLGSVTGVDALHYLGVYPYHCQGVHPYDTLWYRVAKTHRIPQVADHFPQKSH